MSVAGTLIKISTAAVPEGFCISNLQADWPTLVALLTGQLIGTSIQQSGAASVTVLGINVGRNAPAAEDQDKPWLRLDSNGNPDRLYWFNNGLWLSRHPQPTSLVTMWDGTGSIDTFDGGEAGVVTATSGPFWEVYAAMNAKFPVGLGTTPNGTIIGIGSTGGEDEHILTGQEVGKLVFKAASDDGDAQASPNFRALNQLLVNEILVVNNGGSNQGGYDESTVYPTEQEPHNNLPPYSGIYFIRRTARLFYRI